MRKSELIVSLSESSSLSKADAKICVDTILEAITAGIITGDGVEIREFGSFYKKHRKARIGINPKTNERTQVGEKFVPSFKPSKLLKEVVNN
ncbi:Integration host factor beta subunit [uncultured Candidatus Thioglobus sp.]|nr:Integration host factor beta subunit [uncultured Candidatus Thioglobus sp.]